MGKGQVNSHVRPLGTSKGVTASQVAAVHALTHNPCTAAHLRTLHRLVAGMASILQAKQCWWLQSHAQLTLNMTCLAPTLKPPPWPSRLVSTVPGLGVLHMLHAPRRAQLVLPQPGQVQSPSLNMPAHGGGWLWLTQTLPMEVPQHVHCGAPN